ncbi:hypothetical protein QN277_021226 [Acacia crassicarpa]|uniref:CASP-like protein n=1 Tax=Acacia crassicarpa TaxID=499986 RepID=A0AAE1MP90_9FABA|nr:hypothetical protein QN277_021226 [Acacia crassicarpa]
MSTTVDVPETSSIDTREKAPLLPAPRQAGWRRGMAIMDFILRLGALAAAIGAAAAMGTSDQTLPFSTQFFRFEASYDDFPTFQFFVIAMAIVAGYLVLSLPLSVVTIVRPQAVGARLLLVILDTVFMSLAVTSGAAAAAIVYLAHNGNQRSNWLAVCSQFTDFCQATSGAVVSSLIAVLLLDFLIIMSAFTFSRNR